MDTGLFRLSALKIFSRRLLKILAALLCLSFSSCGNMGAYMFLFGEDQVEERYTGFLNISGSELPSVGSDSVYSALVITDPHFGGSFYDSENIERFMDFLEKVFSYPDERFRPKFLINLGDTADGGHEVEFVRYNEYIKRIQKLAEKLGVVENESDFKVYTTIGNHDLYNNGWSKWRRLVYPHVSSFRFTMDADSDGKKMSFYFLDTGNGAVGKKQLDDFENWLKIDRNPKILCTHYPVYADGIQILTLSDTAERNYLLTLFSKYNVKVLFGGHTHLNFHENFGTFRQENTGALFANKYCRLLTIDEKNGLVETKLLEY